MLNFDVQYLKGVGPNRAKKLNKLGIFTINDLLNYFPVKYEDRRTLKKINELNGGDKSLLKIKIYDTPKKSYIKKNMTLIKFVGKDETGFITLSFFNQNYLMNKLKQNEWYYVFGNVKAYAGKFEMTNPDIENISKDYKAGKIMPIYGLTYGLTNNELIKLVLTALTEYSKKIEDIIPNDIRNKYNLLSRKNSIIYLHFPSDGRKYSLAKKTIAFEKLLIMHLGLMAIKGKLKTKLQGMEIKNYTYAEKLLEFLPYELTNAQIKVIKEIKDDMSLPKPMNRLVQGDVGSGKTIVAIYAMLIAASSGFQSSMMAPTEILAQQHYDTIREYVERIELNIKISFLSGSTKESDKKEILNDLKLGKIDIIIGTHALIEDNVIFKNIGLVVTDEQHRFGVRQRAMLSNKGKNPDVLVMTATPIPRTLALMIYGDLDISIIDEMPIGRQTIKTSIINGNQKEQAFDFIKDKIKNKNQAYIVAPLVEESENMELDSATEIYAQLSNNYFANYNLGLLHGKMKNSEKEEIMERFYKGEIDVLVSTTVIEVGVNVPNAVVIMVLNSERFGLAQLHQLRGRVGRGKDQSYCILVNESKSKKSKERMNILKVSNNGFEIAEEDLKIRGPGDFFGTAQHGLSKIEMQNLVNDVNVVQEVQLLSKKIISENPNLQGSEYNNLKFEIINLFKDENIVFN
ncbi:MAG: ATP-dependent DNA helicase RecG [Tissierellia bacterium]|nr:ATP-dependent DNA helicase RecG [Tissierellia bacterium]